MFLILALGSLYTITYQNVSATGDEIVSNVIEINNNTANGPVLNNNDFFGISIANIGDLNGDGISDIAVGATGDDAGGENRGAIHVMLMNSNGSVSNTIEINNNTANGPVLNNNDFFGSSIANIGDLNGDGISDIAVGATGDDAGGASRGAIHVMLMNSNGSVSNTIEINNNTANGPVLLDGDSFGFSIANIGDLNNDSISDIAVGANGDDAGGSDRGAIHVMLMNSNGTVSNTIEINNNTANGPALIDYDYFGSSIANIGDLNNDGILDIAVGAEGDGPAFFTIGAIHVMLMNSNGSVSSTIKINNNTANGPVLNNNDLFGSSIANIGDLNGDGISDIAVGASNDDAGGTNRGAIHVMLMNSNGSVSNTIEINNNTANGPVLNNNDNFGISIANIGDLNADGIFDIAVGAYADDAGGTNRGAIHVLFVADIIPPTITNITSNATSSGVLKVGDTISFTLSLDSAENGATINGTYNSVPLSWNSIDNGTTYTATYTISEGDADQITPLQITGVTITDSAGNTSLPFDGTDILDTIDANSPVITLNGTNPQTIEQGAGYTELGAITNDSSTITINSTNFTDLVGTYTIYYDSTDASNNTAIQVIRTVNVVDTTPPTFSSAVLNEGTGTFTITFNEIITASSINSIGFSIRDNNTSTSTITLSTLELTTTANGTIISFNMTMTNRQSVIAFNVLVLDIGAGAVRDISGNTIIMSTDNPITTTLDTIPPTLTFTSITPNNGTLGIGDDIVIQINANNETGLTLLSGTINNETITSSETTPTSSFDYRKTITINNTMVSGSAEHTNFPLLVSIQNDPNLNNATVQASGQDIRFTTINDTPLHYEITSFSNNHTSGNLSAWIMIPTLYASNDTKIYMYYSNSIVTDGQNATAVWDSDYDGVWHFDGDMLDSTSNDNDGTNFNSTGTTGIIGGARSFDGNDYISYSDSEFPSGNNPRTLSAWVNHVSLPVGFQGVLVYGTEGTGQAYGLFQNSSNLIVGGYADDITLNTTPTTNDWYHFAMTYDGATVRTYIDGSPDITGTKSWSTVLNEFRVGQQVNNLNEFFTGQIDEIRISDTVRTADWIKTEYNNQNSGSFYSVSAPEKLVTPVYYDLTYTVAEGDTDIDDDATAGITYNITLVDTAGNPTTLAATIPSISSPGVDANSPIITLNGLNPQIIEQGEGYTELNATTNDGSTITINSTNFTDLLGTYTIYYDSTDTAGNNAIQVNRTVIVSDTTAPIITLNGTNPQTIEQGAGYTELNATTNDGSTITINSTNFTDLLGTYTIYYDSTDAFNNNDCHPGQQDRKRS